ncbi:MULTISPECIES: Eco57I restriction-modification methylase domain-containing protein [unclassified Thiocapsa]|uniref:Eco57I restriction-modification methylase domain-containing protein n=1 Tax=unclassified Thiocapsa TaxID=2641286 RepID=UPI0035B287CA
MTGTSHGSPQAALSGTHKDTVKAWVPKARALLQKDLKAQLDRLGIPDSGKPKPLSAMQLQSEAQAIRGRLDALLHRDSLAEGTAKRGYDNVLRELTYTHLNRLVGLKAMEARQLLYLPPPSAAAEGAVPEETEVITPVPGQARSRFLRDFRAAGGSRYKYEDDAEEALLRDGLTAAYRHLNTEIRLVFDPDHEYACVWPTHGCLVRLIDMINKDLPAEAYRAADFLGWIYQFFNRDEKKRVRDETKGTPRSPYELSVINQFYTPFWVVKALVDNTLGRLWLQMHPASKLKASAPPPLPGERTDPRPVADYLVPRTGERIRYQRLGEDGKVHHYKRARDIRLLDPACGTMHFGQYAFGLFLQMYLDEIDHAGEDGWPAEPSVRDPAEIPAAILEHNLFGIDIDPRAIQIASLSLMLTAKEAGLGLGLSPADVKIRRSNLVVASAVNVGEEQLGALVDNLGPRLGSPALRDRLFHALWENLRYVGEMGSLIQVHEGVSAVFDDWVEAQAKAKGLGKIIPDDELPLFAQAGMMDSMDRDLAKQLVLQRKLLQAEADALQQELLAAIESAAGADTGNPAERLFAEDTARGLALLQILSRPYDVVVMNPPYGAFVPKVKKLVEAAYPLTKNDIYAAFIDRATRIVEPEGYIGALVSATFVNLKSFEKLRTEILLKRNPLMIMLDLGFGILDDATVEAAAIVIKGSQ